MSIILDALHKIQENNNYVELSDSQMDNFDALEQSRKENKRQAIKTTGILALIFAIVFNIFLFRDNSPEQSAKVEAEIPHAIATPIDSSNQLNESLNELKTLEENKALNEKNNDLIESSSLLGLEIQESEPVLKEEIIEEFLVETEPPSTTESVPVTAEEIVVKDEIVPLLDEKNTIEEAIPAINLDPFPEWINEGTKEFQRGSFNNAMAKWKRGFKTLSSETQLYSIMINYKPELARNMLFQLVSKKLPAFTLTAAFRKKKAYYTLIMPQQNAMETSKAAILHHTDIKPFLLSKQEILNRIKQIPKPKITTKKKPKKIVKAKPVNITKLISNAEVHVRQGNYQQAIMLLKPHLKSHKNNWGLLFWLGSAQLGLGNLTQADNLFIQSQTINPNLPQVWTQRALIAQEVNDHTSALDHLFRAQDLAPKTPEIILNIAYSYEALGDKNGAVYAYKEFLGLTDNKKNYEDLRQSARIRINDLVYQ